MGLGVGQGCLGRGRTPGPSPRLTRRCFEKLCRNGSEGPVGQNRDFGNGWDGAGNGAGGYVGVCEWARGVTGRPVGWGRSWQGGWCRWHVTHGCGGRQRHGPKLGLGSVDAASPVGPGAPQPARSGGLPLLNRPFPGSGSTHPCTLPCTPPCTPPEGEDICDFRYVRTMGSVFCAPHCVREARKRRR